MLKGRKALNKISKNLYTNTEEKKEEKKMEKTSEKKIFQTRKLCIEESCKKRDLIKSFTLITFNTAMYMSRPIFIYSEKLVY